jgi:hypothetical protein
VVPRKLNYLENVHMEDREGDGRITLRCFIARYFGEKEEEEEDGIGSRSCPMMGFDITGAQPSGYVTLVSVSQLVS